MKRKEGNISATENNFLEVLERSYKAHYNLLYNYGLKFVNDAGLIEDFIQDIFVRLCKRGNLHDIDDLKIYLLRAMRNMAYDYYAARHDNLSVDDIEFSLSDDEDAFRRFFTKDDEEVRQYHSLQKAINSLPPQQKQILYLFYIKDLSHKEIAEILDITPQASMNSVSKTLRRLREMLL